MKKYIHALVFAPFIFINCSSNASQNTARQNTAEAIVTPPPSTLPANAAAPTPSVAKTPIETLAELERINREAFNSPPPKPTRTPISQANSNPNSSFGSRPAPDDSTISSTINNKGQPVEMRVFNHNQFLLKIERIYITPEQKILKVYLKSGKVVKLKDEQLPNFDIASISTILNAAGTAE